MISETVMTKNDPQRIVRAALTNGEIDRLLLGAPEYQYLPKYSPAPGNTDLVDLLTVIYDGLDAENRATAKAALEKAIRSLSGVYEAIDAIATCIFLEAKRRSDGRSTLGLPIEEFAGKLQATIRTFEARLRADKTGGGWNERDGVLGDLRRLSRITESHGGPPFCR